MMMLVLKQVPVWNEDGSSADVANLRHQNQKLQAIIKQMKEDMESLTRAPTDRLDSREHSSDNSRG